VPQPGVGDLVAVGVREALDEAVLAQPPQVVGGRAGVIVPGGWPEELGEQRAHVAAGESGGGRRNTERMCKSA